MSQCDTSTSLGTQAYYCFLLVGGEIGKMCEGGDVGHRDSVVIIEGTI
jgi:hypothetical protein